MIQVVLVILVYILGPVLVLRWAIKRYKSGEKTDFTEIVAVVFAVGLIGLLMYSYSGNITQDDAAELDNIVAELNKRYEFPVKAKFQDKSAVFGEAHARYLEIRIYGVSELAEQNKITEIMHKLRRQFASKPIVINFLREEIWEESSDGSRKPLREKELSLARIRVE